MRYIKSVLKYADESGIKCSFKHFNMVELDNPVRTIPTDIYKKLNKLALDEAKDDDGAMLYLLLSITGARIKDIENISDDNFTTSSIHYCPSKTNSATITVPITRTVARLLSSRIDANKKNSFNSKEQAKKIFPRHDRNSLYYAFKKWVNSTNIKGEVVKDKVSADGTRSHEVIDIKDFIRPHKVRSTFISEMLMNGVDEATVKSFSGHSKNSVAFNSYVAVNEKHRRQKHADFMKKIF
jgi:integrase